MLIKISLVENRTLSDSVWVSSSLISYLDITLICNSLQLSRGVCHLFFKLINSIIIDNNNNNYYYY